MVEVEGDLEMVANAVSGEWITVDDINNTGVTFALYKMKDNFILKVRITKTLKNCDINMELQGKNITTYLQIR